MKIDEAINFVENMMYLYRPTGEQLEDWYKLLNLLRWYREQDLIRREDVMPVIKRHHYLLSDRINSTDYGMFTSGIEQVMIEQIPKAEPPFATDINVADKECHYCKHNLNDKECKECNFESLV